MSTRRNKPYAVKIVTVSTEEEMNRVRVQFDKSYEQIMSNPQGLAIAMSEVIAAGDWRMFFYDQIYFLISNLFKTNNN